MDSWNCKYCGEEFEAYPSEAKSYCSQECYHQDISTSFERECQICGEVFETIPSNDCKTCSRECGTKLLAEKNTKDDKECAAPDCTNMFHPSGPDVRFCSHECSIGNRKSDGRTWVEVECGFCGDMYRVKPSKKDSTRFCSKKCQGKWKSENYVGQGNPAYNSVSLVCEVCDSDFEVWESEKDSRRCCSRECSAKWKSENLRGEDHPRYSKVELECESCGESFEAYESSKERRRCCSKDCMGDFREENWNGSDHPNWKEGGGQEKYYGDNWGEMRGRALDRDDGCCVVCGRGVDELGRSPDVHHVIPLRCFDEPEDANFLGNLISLCKRHHMYVEGWSLAPAERVD